MMVCKDKCRFEKKANRWTYSSGYKMCTVCEKSMKADNTNRCYCCSHVFRSGAQENRYRQVRTANAPRIE